VRLGINRSGKMKHESNEERKLKAVAASNFCRTHADGRLTDTNPPATGCAVLPEKKSQKCLP
jgi:hypothetical protein